MNVMVDKPGIRTAIEGHPDWRAERQRGKRLAAVAVDLGRAPAAGLAELLTGAWEGKTPAALTG